MTAAGTGGEFRSDSALSSGRRRLTGAAASRYRLGDREPGAAVLPDDEAEVSGVLALASEGGLGVVPWGGGSHQSLGNVRAGTMWPWTFVGSIGCWPTNRAT